MEFHNINTTLKSRIGPLRPNSIIDWVPSDSKELFLNNLQNPEKRKRLEKMGWTEDSIKYRGNDFGFRMNEDFTNIIDDELSDSDILQMADNVVKISKQKENFITEHHYLEMNL